jgi:hypothetical protein
MTCWCCEKDRHNRFCRCSNIHCHQCHKCSIHCECAKSPTLDPEGERAICRGPNCHAVIYWRVNSSGRRQPFNSDGSPHHATCVDVGSFRQQKAVKR